MVLYALWSFFPRGVSFFLQGSHFRIFFSFRFHLSCSSCERTNCSLGTTTLVDPIFSLVRVEAINQWWRSELIVVSGCRVRHIRLAQVPLVARRGIRRDGKIQTLSFLRKKVEPRARRSITTT